MNATIEGLVFSISAVAIIIAIAYALGFRGKQRFASEREVRALTAPHGGARELFRDIHGKGALALLNDGRLLAAKVMGNEIATRVFAQSAVQSVKVALSRHSLRVTLKFDDFSFPSIRLVTEKQALPYWLEILRRGAEPK